MKVAVVIVAMLASMAATVPDYDPDVFSQHWTHFLPLDSFPSHSVRMMNKLMEIAFPDVEPIVYASYMANNGSLCERDIDHKTNSTSCDKLKAIMTICYKRFIEKMYGLKNHLEQHVQQMLDLRADGVSAMIDFVCQLEPDKLSDLKNYCTSTAIWEATDVEIKLNKTMSHLKFESRPTRASMCEIIISARPLLETQLQTTCTGNNTASVKAYMDYFDAPLKPCLLHRDKQPQKNSTS